MIKKIALYLFLLVNSFWAYAETSAGVLLHFDPTSQAGWSAVPLMLAPEMVSIKGITTTANQNAWIFGLNTSGQELMSVRVNGQIQQAVPCPFNNVAALLPAYPETGEKSNGWTVAGAFNPVKVHYFDGENWTAVQSIKNLINIYGSNGSGWLIAGNATTMANVMYFDFTKKSWMPVAVNAGPDLGDAAANGYLYHLTLDKNLQLYKVDGQGNAVVHNITTLPSTGLQYSTVLAENNRVFVYVLNGAQAYYTYSMDGGDTWLPGTSTAPLVDPSPDVDATFSMVQGVVRAPAGDLRVYASYLDLKQTAPIWQAIPMPSADANSDSFVSYPDVSGDGNEHCEFIRDATPASPIKLYCYDITEQAWHVSQAMPDVRHIPGGAIAILGHNKVAMMAIEVAGSGAVAGLYYDGQIWHETEFPTLSSPVSNFTFQNYYNAQNIWAGASEFSAADLSASSD